jgi:hypothetical protein
VSSSSFVFPMGPQEREREVEAGGGNINNERRIRNAGGGGLRNPLGELNANMNPAPGVEEDFEAHAAVVGDRPAGCYVVGEFVDVLDTVGKWCEGQIKEVRR